MLDERDFYLEFLLGSNKSAFDREIEDFERRLLNTEKIPVGSKVKPNLSEDWLKNLKQRLQKTLNIVY